MSEIAPPKSKVVKNYIYNISYEVLKIFAPLITTPYVSRVFGASGVGTYSYIQSIAWYFVLIGTMGTSLYGQREIAYVQHDPQKRTKVFWEIEIFCCATVIIGAGLFAAIFWKTEPNGIIYHILTLEVIAYAFDISWLYKGVEDFKVTVIRNFCVKLLGIILVFIFVKRPEDLPLYTFCVTIPTFLGNLSLWLGVKKYIVHMPKAVLAGIKKHIKPILILFIPQVAIDVYVVLDKTMIGILASDISEVGYYTQAQKIIKIVLLVVSSLGVVMLPAMSAAFAKGNTERIKNSINKAFRFVFMLSFALIAGICATAHRFVPIFFGKGYDLVAPLMIIISPIIIAIGMSNVIGRQYLLPTKQQNAFAISVLIGAGINFILNLILIPKYNAIGASIATVLSEISVTVVQIFYVRKQLSLSMIAKACPRYIVASINMFAVVGGVGTFLDASVVSLIILVICGIGVYLLELFIIHDEMVLSACNMLKKRILHR